MASINFSIGSTFSGEGFKQLQSAMSNSAKNIKQTAQVTSQMVSTLGMMDQSFSQTANAIGGMMSAISSGNPYLIAIQAAMTGIVTIQKYMQSESDKLKERMDELAESVKIAHQKLVESVNNETIDNYQRLITECENLTSEFDRMTKQAEDFVNIVNKIDAARDTGKNIEFQIRRAQAESEGASKVDLAKMDLEQTKKEGDQKIKRATENLDKAITKRKNIQDEQNLIEEQIKKREAHQLELQKKLEDQGSIDAKISEQTTKTMQANQEVLKKLIKQREELIEKEKQAGLEIDLEEQNVTNAELGAKLANTKAYANLKSAQDQETRDQEAKEKAAEEKAKAEAAKKAAEEKAKAETKAQKEKEKEKKTQQERAKEQSKAQILAEIEEQQRRIEEQRQRDELRKEANIRATQQILGGNGGGSDGSYRDENGGLHLTSDGRNNALWAAADGSDSLRELKSNLINNWALKGIKGSNGELNRRMQNYINSAEFEGKYRKAYMTDKAWNEFKKKTAKGGRNMAHSGEYNQIAREAAQGGGGYGGQEQQETLQITSPQLNDLNTKLDNLIKQLNNLGLK